MLKFANTGSAALYILFASACFSTADAGAPPLIRSTEETASYLGLEFKRPAKELLLACELGLTEFPHTDTELSRLHTNWGAALEQLDQHDEARGQFRKAILAQALRDEPWRQLGWSYWGTSNYTQSAQAFREALKRHTTAEALAGLGSSLRRMETNDPEVPALFEQSLLISPDYTWVLVEQAWMFYLKRDYETAIAVFENVLRLDTNYSSAAYGLSLSYSSTENLDKALVYVDQAIQIDPKDVDFVIQRASVLRKLKRNKIALSEARKAIEIDPSLQDGYVETALALRNLGRLPEGLQALDSGVEIAGNYLFYIYAELLSDDAQWEKSLAMIDKAIATGDVDERDYNLRSFILLNLDRNKAAIEAAQQALNIDPLNRFAHLYVAYSEVGLGNAGKGTKAFLTGYQNGLAASEVSDFIAYLISHSHFLLAAKVRLEVAALNAKASSD
ncbi:MAG: tetratricopeptide (TPR) repeat protein [Paracoccaceae bacterium]|jgi:tetratricopeptide (TPR) repeat protein